MSTNLDLIPSQRTSSNVYGADIFNCSRHCRDAGSDRPARLASASRATEADLQKGYSRQLNCLKMLIWPY